MAKPVTKKASKVKNPSAYKTNVLGTNANLKDLKGTFGYCRSILLNNAKDIKLPTKWAKILRDSKSKKNYEYLSGLVRTTKNGKHSPFYILQCLHTHENTIVGQFKVNASTSSTKNSAADKAVKELAKAVTAPTPTKKRVKELVAA